jgi:hypothetical protein
MQDPASFNLDAVKKKIDEMIKHQNGPWGALASSAMNPGGSEIPPGLSFSGEHQ